MGEPKISSLRVGWKTEFFLFTRFCTLFADQLLMAAVPLIVYKQTGSIAWSGLAYAVEWLPRVITLPIIGALVDVVQPRKQFLICDALRFLIALGMASIQSPLSLMLASVFLTLANAFSFVSLENAVGRHLGKERTANLQAKLQTVDQLSYAFGPVAAGLLVSANCLNLLFFTAAAGFALGVALIWTTFHVNVKLRAVSLKRLTASLRISARVISSSLRLKRLAFYTALVNLVEGVCIALLPALVIGGFGHSASAVGILLGLSSVTSVIVLLFLARASFSLNQIAVASGVTMGLSAFGMGLAPSFQSFASFFLAFVGGRSGFVVFMRTSRIRLIPPVHLGKVIGSFLSLILLPLPISGLIVTVLGTTVPAHSLILLISAFAIGSFIVSHVLWPRLPRGKLRGDN